MSVMEFILVAISIIIALGIAEILRGITDLLRANSIRASWLGIGLALWTFLHFAQLWWSMWQIRLMPTWTFPLFLFLLVPLSLLYMIARMSFPQAMGDQDLREYYRERSSTLWVLVAIIYLIFPIGGRILLDVPLISVLPATQIGLAGLALSCARFTAAPLHAVAIALLIAHTSWRGSVVVLGP